MKFYLLFVFLTFFLSFTVLVVVASRIGLTVKQSLPTTATQEPIPIPQLLRNVRHTTDELERYDAPSGSVWGGETFFCPCGSPAYDEYGLLIGYEM